jgi:hypothetical protein
VAPNPKAEYPLAGDLSRIRYFGPWDRKLPKTDARSIFLEASPNDGNGGVVLFKNDVQKRDFQALLRVMDIVEPADPKRQRRYAAYLAESTNPCEEGYLAQLRLVSAHALELAFREIGRAAGESFKPQPLPIHAALWHFIETERKRWGTDPGPDLQGRFMGDENHKETLSFGLCQEDHVYGICRIWSRAWLVTK